MGAHPQQVLVAVSSENTSDSLRYYRGAQTQTHDGAVNSSAAVAVSPSPQISLHSGLRLWTFPALRTRDINPQGIWDRMST